MDASLKPAHAALDVFHPAVRMWFSAAFEAPTSAQQQAWEPISQGRNTLLLAPTGSGKTLAAFLVAIDRIMFRGHGAHAISPEGPSTETSTASGVKTLYISPLKALGVDVERNLRAPLAGVSAVANREGFEFHAPSVGVRSGDTPSAERTRMTRQPPDILISTPESLYLMLTSSAREILRNIDTVIIDEIHSMVGTKRGSHLFLSLERLEDLRSQSETASQVPLQRIGLSATQRPLEEVARLLGGAVADADEHHAPQSRDVAIVQAGRSKAMEIRVEVPVEDMAKLGAPELQSGPAAAGPTIPSIWPSIHPRLVQLIREHRSTMIFVNSRRLAERMAAAINEVAEEEIALAHHGSIAKEQRLAVEDRLKRGSLPAIVATSSLELGIDMGAVDLVIQIESPPSIASGIQRIGRAGHQVGVPSKGTIFPKYRGDLLACSAVVERMHRGHVEQVFYPRNPLDVLAQQIVAMVALEARHIDDLYRIIRGAAPFAELTRNVFESVLDLLAGRYPSSEFAELRPRVNWDRGSGVISPRKGSQRIAIANGGTIPDRGLYGVFLATGEDKSPNRVGELDEEMVFETRPGDVFLLGATSWRAIDITHDRVLVEPAPGEPGRMPFWRGDGPGRPLEFGQAIGTLTSELVAGKRDAAESRLVAEHGLEQRAAWNLMNYLDEQVEATGEIPSDRTIVLERFIDEIGDWRIVLMTPFGSRIHAPWATAVMTRLREEVVGEIDMMWSDDGIVFRVPRTDAEAPDVDVFFPNADEVEDIVVKELGGTALFAARFRENAARALLLPRRRPGQRTPLWLQRRKSADLLNVAARYERFPIMLETYRECLRDVFDLPGLKQVLRDVANRRLRVHPVETSVASPFAASLLFSYTGNFLYDGDAPLAERRAATLALDHNQLRELLGDAELRRLLDAGVVDELAMELQRLNGKYPVRDADGIRDLLRLLGDLTRDELQNRVSSDLPLDETMKGLVEARQVVSIPLGGQQRFIAAEDAGRYRDAIGVVPPQGLPEAFLETAPDALADLVGRYVRTHVPFRVDDVAQRFGLGNTVIQASLEKLQQLDQVIEGEFLPNGRGREWCGVDVLRKLKQRSLAKLRKQIEPVEPERWAKFLTQWQGLDKPRRGLDGLLDVIEQLQGTPLPASELERAILPARVRDYEPAMLDELCSAGEVVWRGTSAIGTHDGRVALYLTDSAELLGTHPETIEDQIELQIVELLGSNGAQFFDSIVRVTGGFANEVLASLWRLVWAGHVTNDTLAPLRSLHRAASSTAKKSRRASRSAFRSRRARQLPGSEGRWALATQRSSHATTGEVKPEAADVEPTATERRTALAMQLIDRYGIVTRETVLGEGIEGGFVALYPVFKAMEESGRILRGYFIAGQGAAQFAASGAEDRLRDVGRPPVDGEAQTAIQVLAATDPANLYGAALKWPDGNTEARPQRVVGASVVIVDGQLLGYLAKSQKRLLTFLPQAEPMRSKSAELLAEALAAWCDQGHTMYLQEVDGMPVEESDLAFALTKHGFVRFAKGYQRKVMG